MDGNSLRDEIKNVIQECLEIYRQDDQIDMVKDGNNIKYALADAVFDTMGISFKDQGSAKGGYWTTR